MDKDLISINIIAYNAQNTLEKTLESIVQQQEVKMEIIFVNDCSNDETLLLIENFKEMHPLIKCKILSNTTNLGITKSHNIALSNSTGNFIAILDSDDVWSSPQKLKKQLGFLKENPDHIAVGSQMNIVDKSGKIIHTTSYKLIDEDIKNKMLVQNQIGHSTVLFRNLNLKYDESLYIWEDYEFFLRLGTKYKLANIDEVLIDYLYIPKVLTLKQKLRRASTEIQIRKMYKKQYPNFWVGYCKGIFKYILFLLHLK